MRHPWFDAGKGTSPPSTGASCRSRRRELEVVHRTALKYLPGVEGHPERRPAAPMPSTAAALAPAPLSRDKGPVGGAKPTANLGVSLKTGTIA